MKLIADYSNFRFGQGTNPDGGGYILVSPETQEEDAFLREAYLFIHEVGGEKLSMVPCRLVWHAPNPHDDGLNPVFVELVHRYKWVVKGYPKVGGETHD